MTTWQWQAVDRLVHSPSPEQEPLCEQLPPMCVEHWWQLVQVAGGGVLQVHFEACLPDWQLSWVCCARLKEQYWNS
jgi:hypothetical protein